MPIMTPSLLGTPRAALRALFYALLAALVFRLPIATGLCHTLTSACIDAENLQKVVSGTSGAIHGGSSPLERTLTLCK